jgi:hypothetical protein
MTRGGIQELQEVEFLGGKQHQTQGNAGAALSVDASAKETQVFTLNMNITMGVPTNTSKLPIGTVLTLVLVQDATGGRTVTWNAAWRNAPSGLGSSATNGQRALFEFKWDGVAMQYVGNPSVVFA